MFLWYIRNLLRFYIQLKSCRYQLLRISLVKSWLTLVYLKKSLDWLPPCMKRTWFLWSNLKNRFHSNQSKMKSKWIQEYSQKMSRCRLFNLILRKAHCGRWKDCQGAVSVNLSKNEWWPVGHRNLIKVASCRSCVFGSPNPRRRRPNKPGKY